MRVGIFCVVNIIVLVKFCVRQHADSWIFIAIANIFLGAWQFVESYDFYVELLCFENIFMLPNVFCGLSLCCYLFGNLKEKIEQIGT